MCFKHYRAWILSSFDDHSFFLSRQLTWWDSNPNLYLSCGSCAETLAPHLHFPAVAFCAPWGLSTHWQFRDQSKIGDKFICRFRGSPSVAPSFPRFLFNFWPPWQPHFCLLIPQRNKSMGFCLSSCLPRSCRLEITLRGKTTKLWLPVLLPSFRGWLPPDYSWFWPLSSLSKYYSLFIYFCCAVWLAGS